MTDVISASDARKQIMPQMGCVVGIPGSRNPPLEWSIALAVQSWPTNMNICYVPVRCENKSTGSVGPKRDQAREMIIEGALELRAPYVWFIDDDVEVPFSACRQLLATIKQAPEDVIAVGGIYSTKTIPSEPVVYCGPNGTGAFWKWKKDTIFECDLIGTGCMMLKTEPFRTLEKPWFKDIDEPTIKITDDGWFCSKVRNAGYKILADAHVLCTHWDSATNTPYRLADNSYPMVSA